MSDWPSTLKSDDGCRTEAGGRTAAKAWRGTMPRVPTLWMDMKIGKPSCHVSKVRSQHSDFQANTDQRLHDIIASLFSHSPRGSSPAGPAPPPAAFPSASPCRPVAECDKDMKTCARERTKGVGSWSGIHCPNESNTHQHTSLHPTHQHEVVKEVRERVCNALLRLLLGPGQRRAPLPQQVGDGRCARKKEERQAPHPKTTPDQKKPHRWTAIWR